MTLYNIPRRVFGISSDGDDRRIFLGLKFSILGFFWVGKCGKYFFGWLELSRDFLGVILTFVGYVFLGVSSVVKPDEVKDYSDNTMNNQTQTFNF